MSCAINEARFALGLTRRPDQADEMSAGARRTMRNKADIERGVHPATKVALRRTTHPGDTETCGSCKHHFRRGSTYHKCEHSATHGPATDIRVSWPACIGWEPKP